MEVIQKKQYTNVENTSKPDSGNEEMVKRTKIENSPFEIIEMEGYAFGTMGQYRITDKGNSVKEIKEELEKITWNRLIQVVMILNEVNDKNKEIIKTQ